MIVVDSSVWIDHFRNRQSAPVLKLRAAIDLDQVIVGDLIMLEVLRGARDDRHAAQLQATLQAFMIVPMLNERLAIKASKSYRVLRERGITVRAMNDLVIATFCEDRHYRLLHSDRDFDVLAPHLGLTLA